MSKQIDLEKLRRIAEEANTPEQWYLEADLTSCSYSYDKAFIAEFSPSVAMELLDRIAALEKDAARMDWMDKQGRVCIERVREGHIKGDLRWDVEYGHYDDSAKSKQGMRQAIDTAMEAKHG